MEVEQLQSDLLALRQLYGLLQNITGFRIPTTNLENAGNLLDKKALQLLKNLLDDAGERLSMRTTRSQMTNVAQQSVDVSNKEASKFEQISRTNHHEHETGPEFSEQVAKAIEEIDSRILDLQLMTMNPVKNSCYDAADLSKTLESKTRYETLSRQASQPAVLAGNDGYLSKKALKNNHALSQLTSQLNGSQTSPGTSYVQGFRVPDMSRDEHDPGTRPSLGIIQNDPTATKVSSSTTRKTTRRAPFKPPPDHDHHKVIMRPTLLMEQDDQIRKSDYHSESETERERSLNLITSPTVSSSSSFISSSSATESDGSENHPQSSSSYSVSPIRRPAKTYFSRRERGSEKRIGGFRRIKNKLGLVFHHHHHHHHHHHDHDPHRSNWKLLQRIFHLKTKARKNNYNKRNGTRKSLVKVSSNNNKRGRDIEHFHALIEGLMHHVGGCGRGRGGRLKKPKTGKGGRNNKWLGKGTGWRQRFGGRGGMKMVNRRGRIRVVRFANKTPKTLKM